MSIVGTLIGPVADLISKFIPDKDQANQLAFEVATLAEKQAHEQVIAQLAVNKAEAESGSLFKGGWRPATGWLCVSGMAVNFVIVPICGPFLATYHDVVLEPLDLTVMLPILLGMLGLGGLRTLEKTRGVAVK